LKNAALAIAGRAKHSTPVAGLPPHRNGSSHAFSKHDANQN
jgi:hypothetical protein